MARKRFEFSKHKRPRSSVHCAGVLSFRIRFPLPIPQRPPNQRRPPDDLQHNGRRTQCGVEPKLILVRKPGQPQHETNNVRDTQVASVNNKIVYPAILQRKPDEQRRGEHPQHGDDNVAAEYRHAWKRNAQNRDQ